MLLMCWFADAVDGLKLLILLMCWCNDAADVLMLLMHRCCWCAGAAHAADPTDVLMLLIGWCCWCADSVLCSPSPMHCNPTEWQQSVKNLHWRSVVKYQCNWEQLTEVGLMMHQRCKYMTRKGLEKHGCALWKMVVEWDYHIWTWWKCLGGGAGIIISPDDESGCLGGGFSYQQIMKVEVSWSSTEEERRWDPIKRWIPRALLAVSTAGASTAGTHPALHLNSCTLYNTVAQF